MNANLKLLIAFLTVAPVGLWVSRVNAASFDCAQARTKAEKFICADPFISKLDSRLSKAYEADLAKANAEQKQRLIIEELDWIKNMRNWCTTQTCFKHAYWQRLAELETFYMPHSPMYAKASDKAVAIQNILKTAPLYPSSSSNTEECRGIFQALKDMKGVEFVNPVVQVMSYANPKLVPFRREVIMRDAKRFPQNAPLTFNYLCEPNISGSWDNAVDRDGLTYCDAYYGLPPFKLFEIPMSKIHPDSMRYIFYSDAQYGPMNGEGQPHWVSSGEFLQNFFYKNQLGFVGFSSATEGYEFEPNYNTLVKYNNKYYFLLIYRTLNAYWVDVDYARNKDSCSWSPIKNQ